MGSIPWWQPSGLRGMKRSRHWPLRRPQLATVTIPVSPVDAERRALLQILANGGRVTIMDADGRTLASTALVSGATTAAFQLPAGKEMIKIEIADVPINEIAFRELILLP